MFLIFLLALSYNYYCYQVPGPPSGFNTPRASVLNPHSPISIPGYGPCRSSSCPFLLPTSYLPPRLKLQGWVLATATSPKHIWGSRWPRKPFPVSSLLLHLSTLLPLTAPHPTAPDNSPPPRDSISKGSRQAWGPGTLQSTACVQGPALENTCWPWGSSCQPRSLLTGCFAM